MMLSLNIEQFRLEIANGRTDFSGYRFADLKLCLMDLEGFNFSRCSFYNCDFSYTQMQECDLSYATIVKCKMYATYLEHAKFTHCRIYDTNLHFARLTHANLRNAELDRCDCYTTDFVNADFTGCKFHLVDFSYSNLSNSKGLLDPGEWLKANFELTEEGIIVYKTFGEDYGVPEYWENQEWIREVVNPNRCVECGCGINVATLDWVKANYHGDIWKCLIPNTIEGLTGIIVPYNTTGKFRCSILKKLEIVRKSIK